VLLTSVAFAAAVLRLAKHQVVVQELPAVEILARVDVICLDKTGTLTHGDLELDRIDTLPGAGDRDARDALAALVAADPNPNATLRALGHGLTGADGRHAGQPEQALPSLPAGWEPATAVPFSSARKWSAATFPGKGTWVLGAPDVVLDSSRHADLAARVEQLAELGSRVILLAHTDAALADVPATDITLPDGLEPSALAVLEDRVRVDAPDTLAFFAAQGVAAKVISGDHPATVAAVARRAGLDVEGDAVDGRSLPDDPDQLAAAVEAGTIFGRITPHQKRAMVHALQGKGHTVAMTGDGVNDVLALKDADIGIAMGSGSSASRAAAQLVLLSGEFSALPPVVAEGRRVINNIERVANLFLTKTIYAVILAFAIAATVKPFPFLPRHFTVIDALTIGIPGFFLALAPNPERAKPHFLRRVLRFTVPHGIMAAAITFTAYLLAQRTHPPLIQSRTTATLVLTGVALVILVQLVRPMTLARAVLVVAMVAGFALVLAVPFGRHFFELHLPSGAMLAVSAGLVSASAAISVVFARYIDVDDPRPRARPRREGQAETA
jgi:cation-transporting ATPase E